MPSLEQIGSTNALIFKSVRLHALQDSPTAFGSTFARESRLSDEDWIKRARDWNNARSVGYLAVDKGTYCGIVSGTLDENDPTHAHLFSMWVAPGHRRIGVGRALVGAIQMWVRARGANSLYLTVTNCNRAAIDFYERDGFAKTGHTESYPNDPKLFEYEMSRSL